MRYCNNLQGKNKRWLREPKQFFSLYLSVLAFEIFQSNWNATLKINTGFLPDQGNQRNIKGLRFYKKYQRNIREIVMTQGRRKENLSLVGPPRSLYFIDFNIFARCISYKCWYYHINVL